MACKKYFKITAGVECKRDFYVQAEDKEQALEELQELNFLKEETVLFSGKIEVDVVDKDREIVEVTEEEAQPKDVIQSIKDVMEEQGFALVSCGHGINGAQGYAPGCDRGRDKVPHRGKEQDRGFLYRRADGQQSRRLAG